VLYKRVLETVIIDRDPCHAGVVGTIVILIFKNIFFEIENIMLSEEECTDMAMRYSST
jgi:hypothetical protein